MPGTSMSLLLARRTLNATTLETWFVRSSIRERNGAIQKQARFVSQACTGPLPCNSFRRDDMRIRQLQRMSCTSAPLMAANPASPHSFVQPASRLVVLRKESLCTTTEKGTGGRRKRKTFIPVKAAVELSDRARTFFSKLLENPPRHDIVGIRLNYQQSHTGEPRMVFTFDFVTKEEVDPEEDEPVSLDVVNVVDKSDGTTRIVPKPPRDSWNDGRPKLYVSSNAFFKVLGATVDVDTDTMAPILHDAEGNRIDPNA